MHQGTVVVQRIKASVFAAQAGKFQALLAVYESGPEAPAIAQEVAVYLGIKTIVYTLQFAVALAGQGVTAHRTAGANRGCRL